MGRERSRTPEGNRKVMVRIWANGKSGDVATDFKISRMNRLEQVFTAWCSVQEVPRDAARFERAGRVIDGDLCLAYLNWRPCPSCKVVCIEAVPNVEDLE